MLGDFFRINMPYGICRTDAGEWYAFNREYMPLGFNSTEYTGKFQQMNLPIYTKYKGLTEKLLVDLAWSPQGIIRDEENEIIRVFFYHDGTNPVNQAKDKPALWEAYFSRIKRLSKLKQASLFD